MGAYNDDVLFIHIPKCGGTACKEYMAKHLPVMKWPRGDSWFTYRDGRNEITPQDKADARTTVEESRLPIGHIALQDIEPLTGRSPDSFQRIIIPIRNPYHQQVSQWHFWLTRYQQGQRHVHDIHAAGHPSFDTWPGELDSDFHIWYEAQFTAGAPLERKSHQLSYEQLGGFYRYWVTIDGAVPTNVLMLRQETLEHSFPLACAPWIDGTPPAMHRSNESNGLDHIAFINYTSTLDTIERKFKWTFDQGFYDKVPRE